MKRAPALAVAEEAIGFLQGDDIGIDLTQYIQDTIGIAPPVGADALANIVAGNLDHSATETQRWGFSATWIKKDGAG